MSTSRTAPKPLWGALLICALTICLSTPVFAETAIVARLSDFSGEVIVRSQGSWGVKPQKGLPLYSNDKVVTRVGKATVAFEDGAVMNIESNSNVMIEEKEQEKSYADKARVVKRRIRLMLGKFFFKTGKSNRKTTLETPTFVAGLRGTAGTLSIDGEGRAYIQFVEGDTEFTIGEFISGIADDVPTELADMNPVQRAAFVARAAADQADRAAELVASGQMPDAQEALFRALAAEAAAEEVLEAALAMIQNNPDPDVVAEANEVVRLAEEAIQKALEAQQKALDAGATPGAPEGYSPPPAQRPWFDVPLRKEPPIQDTAPPSPT